MLEQGNITVIIGNRLTQCECDSYLKALAQLELDRDNVCVDVAQCDVGGGVVVG